MKRRQGEKPSLVIEAILQAMERGDLTASTSRGRRLVLRLQGAHAAFKAATL